MTTWTLTAPLTELTIPGGSSIEFEAIDPTTGAEVAGVKVTTFAIYGYNVSADTGALEDVVPLYTPEDVGAPSAVSV